MLCSHLVTNLPCLLGEREVFLLGLLDVLFVPQSLHVLQFLVRELQLLLVVIVLLHLGLKVVQLLLHKQKAQGGTRRGESSVQLQLHAQLHRGELICISSSESRGNVTEKSRVFRLILKPDICKEKKKKSNLNRAVRCGTKGERSTMRDERVGHLCVANVQCIKCDNNNMHSTLYGLPYTSSAGLQSAFGKVKDVYYLKKKK